jgi:hypothetical protein
MSHLWLEPFAINAFVPCTQFFCLCKPITNVCTKIPCFFHFHADELWPLCILLHVSLYLLKPTFFHTGCHSKPCTVNAVFMTRLLYVNETMVIHDASKRLQECAANLQQQTMDSWEKCLPRQSECPVYSLSWDSLFFPILSFPSSNTFSLCFSETPGFIYNKPCAGI